MSYSKTKGLALAIAVMLSGCNSVDEAKLQSIGTGMNREQVVATLGQPSSVEMTEILGVGHETLVYKQRVNRTWRISLVLGHVVAKSHD